MSSITIEAVEAESTTLRGRISYTSDLQRFFSGRDFYTEYSVDISDVPRDILTIPLVAHVCPVAWLHGADVYVSTLDSEFYQSLSRVKDVLLEMYPDLLQGGTIYCDTPVTGSLDANSDRTALLFTGGVDSMFSFIRHRDTNPALVNINGWALSNGEQEKWEEVKSYVQGFATDHGLDEYLIRSNMLRFLRNPMLIAHCEPHVLGAWYSSIGHGVGLLGLCAPLAHATGLTDLYMAATHWEDASFPWGSRPAIVENVRWADTETHHDGYAYTRQERIEAISEYVTERESDLTILSCSDGISRNCGRCEKCCRTAIAFLFAGIDPNEYGLPLDSRTFDRVRTQLEAGDWKLTTNKQLYWRDLQAHAPPNPDYSIEGADEFVAWLRRADFEELAERTGKPVRKRALHAVYRNTPSPLFNLLDQYLEIGPFTGRTGAGELSTTEMQQRDSLQSPSVSSWGNERRES